MSFITALKQWLRILTVRKLKKATVVLVCLVFLLIWMLTKRKTSKITSAITCKSKIAQIMFPNPQQRQMYLSDVNTDPQVLETDYTHLVGHMQRQCHDQEHFGPWGDGGWEACMDPQFVVKEPCLVYSFGVGDNLDFEKDIVKKLNCEVHAFDPSLGVASYQFSDQGYFHDYGIDSEDVMVTGGNWKMKKMSTILKELKHQGRTLDYLKLDVEFNEWPAMYEMIQSGTIDRVRQISMETHTPEMDVHEKPDHECTYSTVESMQLILKILLELQKVGFRTYYTSTNYRTKATSRLTGRELYCCHNVHMVNTRHKDNKWQPP